MEVANCRLRLNKVGSDVPLQNVTPAEAMFLHILHGPSNGGLTFGEEFGKIEVVGTAMVEKDVPDQVEPDKAAQFIKGKVTRVAVAAQVIPAKMSAAVPAKGTPSQPDFVAAVAPQVIEPAQTIPAQPEQRDPDTVVPATKGKVLSTKKGLVPRTPAQELARLRGKYAGAKTKDGKPIIDSIWPDKLNPKLPENFKDIDWVEVGSLGVEQATTNYATGGLATTALPV